MRCHSGRIAEIIVARLSEGEKRLLALTVSVRRTLQCTGQFKGDLRSTIRASLRKLVASRQVIEQEGVYTLRGRRHIA